MPRAERRRKARRERSWSPWWLALPAIALAAYAAFAATLALLGDDESPAPSARVGGAEAQPPSAPAAALPAPLEEVAAPTSVAAQGSTAEAGAAASVAVPAASATPAAQRAAVDEPRKVKPKRGPQEHLTEQDRRALDALVEQARKNAR